MAGCKLKPLAIDPCAVWVDELVITCHAIPLNQSEKPEYERDIKDGDVCVTGEEYAALQKQFREVMRRCGDECQ